jgi:hypothetical protein
MCMSDLAEAHLPDFEPLRTCYLEVILSLNIPLVVCLVLALLVAVLAFVREHRLRRALQALLSRILSLWRSHES